MASLQASEASTASDLTAPALLPINSIPRCCRRRLCLVVARTPFRRNGEGQRKRFDSARIGAVKNVRAVAACSEQACLVHLRKVSQQRRLRHSDQQHSCPVRSLTAGKRSAVRRVLSRIAKPSRGRLGRRRRAFSARPPVDRAHRVDSSLAHPGADHRSTASTCSSPHP
jgi:hypothetical protein